MILIAFSCKSPNQNTNPIEEFQKNLVDNGTTGSNVTQVFKDGEIVYNNIANSGALGDKDIDENTIFPIWSMTKTVTTVAMMILLEEGKYKLNDNLSDYLPEYGDIKCKGPDGVYPCEEKLKVITLAYTQLKNTYRQKIGK